MQLLLQFLPLLLLQRVDASVTAPNHIWDFRDCTTDSTVADTGSSFAFAHDGECRAGTEIRMYEGNGDNTGSTFEEKLQNCFEACRDKKSPLTGSWTGFEAKGFVMASSGRCYCENAESTSPEQMSGDTCADTASEPGCRRYSCDSYKRYDLVPAASSSPLVVTPHGTSELNVEEMTFFLRNLTNSPHTPLPHTTTHHYTPPTHHNTPPHHHHHHNQPARQMACRSTAPPVTPPSPIGSGAESPLLSSSSSPRVSQLNGPQRHLTSMMAFPTRLAGLQRIISVRVNGMPLHCLKLTLLQSKLDQKYRDLTSTHLVGTTSSSPCPVRS